MKQPKRLWTLKLSIGADSLLDLKIALLDVKNAMTEAGVFEQCSGSPEFGYSFTLVENHGMTHEKYHQELAKYLEEVL